MRAVRVHTSMRRARALFVPVGLSLISACSLSAPSLADYARQRPRAGDGTAGSIADAGSSGASAVIGGGDSGGSGGTAGDVAGSGGSTDIAGSSGSDGLGGASGAGGASGSGAVGTAGASGSAGSGGAPTTGKALSFLASQVVRVSKQPLGDLTIEAWLNTKMFGPGVEWFEGAAIFDADNPLADASDFGATLIGTHFAFGTGGPDGDVTVISKTSVNAGVWTHVAVSRKRSSGTVIIYVNGVADVSQSSGNTEQLTQGLDPSIGAWTQDGSSIANGLAGQLTEIRLWNTVRTEAQIASNMHTSLRGDETGLIGYWRFDEGTGLVAKDSSASKNDGQLGAGNANFLPDCVTYSPSVITP